MQIAFLATKKSTKFRISDNLNNIEIKNPIRKNGFLFFRYMARLEQRVFVKQRGTKSMTTALVMRTRAVSCSSEAKGTSPVGCTIRKITPIPKMGDFFEDFDDDNDEDNDED